MTKDPTPFIASFFVGLISFCAGAATGIAIERDGNKAPEHTHDDDDAPEDQCSKTEYQLELTTRERETYLKWWGHANLEWRKCRGENKEFEAELKRRVGAE